MRRIIAGCSFIFCTMALSLLAEDQPPKPPAPTAPEHVAPVPPAPAPEHVAPAPPAPEQAATPAPVNEPVQPETNPRTILINFNNVSIIEYIRFVSKITNKNFVFEDADLIFTVTIVSEEPTTIENMMAALIQELRIHGFSLTEQGNNMIIHRNPGVTSIPRVVSDVFPLQEGEVEPELVTQVIRLNTLAPDQAAAILRPLMSTTALLEVVKSTNHIIITDIAANVAQILELLKSIDAPNSGLVIGQYVVHREEIPILIDLATKIMAPISQGQVLLFVPHVATRSIFVVSSPFLAEKTLAAMQYLDQPLGESKILELKDLHFLPGPLEAAPPSGVPPGGLVPLAPTAPSWQLDAQGNWIFHPTLPPGAMVSSTTPPQGYWYIDDQGNWRFQVGSPPTNPEIPAGIRKGPEGHWARDVNGNWVFALAPGRSISPERLMRSARSVAELPLGHIERIQFTTYKLKYRKGSQIQDALARIAIALQQSENSNADLVAAIESVQWLETTNMLILSGTPIALEKLKVLIGEIDIPLRQVFLEMLILETTLSDSLAYGVEWSGLSVGGATSGSESFLATPGSPLPAALVNAMVSGAPNAEPLTTGVGFSLGIIGQKITHHGQSFNSIGAIITALQTKNVARVLLNPKIITEDLNPATVFVGSNVRFPGQAIVNDQGTVVTQNFEYRNVGQNLTVTPIIGNNNVITLIIDQSLSDVTATDSAGPTTTALESTTTRIHVPNGCFVVLSGMLRDEHDRNRHQIPCLGSIPFLGALFSQQVTTVAKSNIMVFIHPLIVDAEWELEDLTKRQQDIFRQHGTPRKSWEEQLDTTLDWLNVRNYPPFQRDRMD